MLTLLGYVLLGSRATSRGTADRGRPEEAEGRPVRITNNSDATCARDIQRSQQHGPAELLGTASGRVHVVRGKVVDPVGHRAP
jgi:hypothetical protein